MLDGLPVNRDEIAKALVDVCYVPDAELPTALWLMGLLGRPLLLEGEAGVGKTEVAKALSALLATRLIRLQCYEGLDQQSALYEWNYQRQLLAIRAREQAGDADAVERHVFSQEYLLERPLLTAIRQDRSPVLLIDEIDRADQEFEALLLEVLSDFQVTIPELGTVTATARPFVILTSNGTRDLSDALRRRCLYHHIDYPDAEREARIIRARMPGIDSDLAAQIAAAVARIRKENLVKVPGVAESLDWAAALMGLGIKDLGADIDAAYDVIATLIKTDRDRAAMPREVWTRLLERVA